MGIDTVPEWLKHPILLTSNNFTPLTRTPWGGKVIAESYKKRVHPECNGQSIGESWEFSCDPAFPSRVLATGETLLEVVGKWPEAILSRQGGSFTNDPSCEILVKLLDAAEPLSLQVHPADNDPNLKPGECGKPESWLVLKAAEGAGIYLGFSKSISRTELRRALLDGAAAKELLHFVPVKAGDYFEIEPGVPHAIGGGVTLLEPQRILTGKAGKTFRLWDWGRRYNAKGQLDMEDGRPRELHIEESLPLVDPERQVGEAFVRTLRRQPTVKALSGGILVREFPSGPYYKTVLCSLPPAANLTISISGGYGALLPLEGVVSAAELVIPQGQPALLAQVGSPFRFQAQEASELAVLAPKAASLSFGN